MRYHVLACDYDGTLAHDGRVETTTLEALRRLRDTGRRIVLVTGRLLDDLLEVFPDVDVFARVVAENGAVLYRPDTRERRALHEPVPTALVDVLRAAGVTPLTQGQVIASTWQPWDTEVLRAIQTLGLELQMVFNKGAVMIVPSGVNKASGLLAALAEMKMSAHGCVGVGDAENDHAFLTSCECAVAVANALPMLKERADWVTTGAAGAGVRELVERLLRTDLVDLEPRLVRHTIAVGTTGSGEEVALPPYGTSVLIAGPSGSGKSTLASALMERLMERAYQICVVDPEGDYVNLPGALVLGDQQSAPPPDEVLDVLDAPDRHVVVNLLGVPLKDRPAFFAALLPHLQELRTRVGRPHWIVVDEAHHMLPADWDPAPVMLPREMPATILVTVHPEALAPDVVGAVESMIGVGKEPHEAIKRFCEARGEPEPPELKIDREAGEAYYWQDGKAQVITIEKPKGERQRHVRKYAEGELGEDKSFYFRGPEDALNLRAQNLMIFLQMADGVDEATWLHHLRKGDYSRWFEEAIKDKELAEEARAVEADGALNASESRERVAEMVTRRYTAPAKGGD
jgi:HAD superfamily hydrolase (TIGR01484 family)